MPKPVNRVENPWEQYFDGIWEFTIQEFQALPRWIPSTDPLTGEVTGIRQFVWGIGDKMYSRFTDRHVTDMNAFWNGEDKY